MSVASLPVVVRTADHLRTTSLCLAVGYGARHDPAGAGGLAHLLEHLLMSTGRDGGPAPVERIERLGGQANAETGLELMLFHAQVHADDADSTAALLLDSVLAPAFSAPALDAERAVVLQEIAAAAADPADVVQEAALDRLFPGHPLGRPVAGAPDEVRGLTADRVRAVHREAFLASPMVLAVVGPKAVAGLPAPGDPVRAAPQTAGGLPPGPPAPAPAWPDEFGWACFTARSAAVTDPGRHAFALLAHLMGGSPAAPLYRRLRVDKGLAYAFQAWDRGYTETGVWRLLVGVDEGNGPAVEDTVRGVLAELAERGPTAEDLLAARRQAEMQAITEAESPLEHARGLARLTLKLGAEWSVERELAALAAVSGADVRAAAARVLDGLVTVVRPEPA